MPRVHSVAKNHYCQMTMSFNHGRLGLAVFECGKPAKAWIKDEFKRIGWKGRQYLCGIHLRAYNKKNLTRKIKRPSATPV